MEESKSGSSNSITVDNAKLITSITFINICFAILLYLKKFPATSELNVSLNYLISLSISLFTGSAILSYIAMAKKSYEDSEVKDEIFSFKSGAYFIGIIVFVISAFLIIHNS